MTKIVGILNITPDSFFDGGRHNEKENALKQLQILLANNVDVVDVGAESTRPNAIPINANQEHERLKNILPSVILAVQKHNQENQSQIEISLDSRHSQTVAWALDLGIDIINDVSGFIDLEMINLAANSGKKIVVMHNLGVPADKNKIVDENLDVMQVLIDWMKNKLQQLLKAGVKKEQIIFDPGVGFGKNSAQSIKILQEIDRLRVLDLPLYVGHSNKSFLDNCYLECTQGDALSAKWILHGIYPASRHGAKDDKTTRAEKTIAVSKYLIARNIEYLRVHQCPQ